jgi:hypothetical protein
MPTAAKQMPSLSVYFVSLTLLLGVSLAQDTAMIFEVSILQDNVELCLPLIAPLNLAVDWGDNGTSPILHNYTATTSTCAVQFPGINHVYTSAGNYTIKLDRGPSPTGPWLSGFGNRAGSPYWSIQGILLSAKLTRVITFGDLGIVTLCAAFCGNRFLTDLPPSLPSTVTSLNYTFVSSSVNSPNISFWNTAAVTTLKSAFYSATVFNQPLNSWDVSSATTLDSMFSSAEVFNQPLSSWRFAPGANLERMFSQAYAFNQPLDMWDISPVTSIQVMFGLATSFNQPLNSWNTSGLTSLAVAFNQAMSFNQPLDRWDTSRFA